MLRGMTAPPPQDDSQRRETAAGEGRAMIAALPLDEQPAEMINDPELARLLGRLGRSIMDNERDSAKRHESNLS